MSQRLWKILMTQLTVIFAAKGLHRERASPWREALVISWVWSCSFWLLRAPPSLRQHSHPKIPARSLRQFQPPSNLPPLLPLLSGGVSRLEASPENRSSEKVITEDDLVKPPKPISLRDLDGEENNPVCDLSCEAILRGQWGYSPEREAEFRNQLTLARHEIATDRVWNDALQSALRAAGDYCDIQDQKAKILGKGNAAPYIRDSVNSRFAERERKLALQYRSPWASLRSAGKPFNGSLLSAPPSCNTK